MGEELQNGEQLNVPAHVAIILDGNGRWAKMRGLPRPMGHREGCKVVEQTVEDAARLGIRYLTGHTENAGKLHVFDDGTVTVLPISQP